MTIGTVEISSILSHLLDIHQISEAELGRKIKVPRATINRLVSGRTPDPRASTLKSIADFFNITIDQLLGSQPLISPSSSTNPLSSSGIALPVIKWEETHDWRELLTQLKPDNHYEWIMVDPSIEEGKFAIKVQGESMWPQFQSNTILIVNPTRDPKNRDFVIAYIKKDNEVIFRQLIIEGKYRFLKAINSIFPTVQIDVSDKIIGVVIQTRSNHK